MMPRSVARLLRRLMLHYGRRMNPERMLARSLQGALRTAARAAGHSQAYRQLLREQGLHPATIGSSTEWTSLPILGKANTFERFTLNELARPVAPTELADVLTSSGRSGRSYGFRLTGRRQHESAWFDIDLGLQDVFDVDRVATLLVNCLPMGVVFHSRAVTVANVSVREDMAISILRDVGPRFAQTVLCADPLFIRCLLAEARVAGVDWTQLNTSVIMGEEVLVEAQRDYIAARMGIDIDGDSGRIIGSSFGVGELGLNLLFETRATIRMRRAMRTMRSNGAEAESLPSLFCFNPLRCHVEVLSPDADGFGELCITMLDPHAVITLPRYATGDVGKLLDRAACAELATLAATSVPWLPVVAVRGRIKDRPPGMPSVEQIKELIYTDHAVADQLTGAFRLALDARGLPMLTLQAHSDAVGSYAALIDRLQALNALNIHARPPGQQLAIEVLAPNAFPWRPLLDYERKFAYVAA